MKFKKKTIVSAIITICLLTIIALIVKISTDEYQKCNQEGLQYYGDEGIAIDAPLAYRTVMENIKYPITNEETGKIPIYDNGHEIYNNLLFNKENKRMHFSEQQIMKDLKHFNNSSNLLLDHYLNSNIPDKVTTNIQDIDGDKSANSTIDSTDNITADDYYNNINLKTETIIKSKPSYLYDSGSRSINKQKTYLYRLDDELSPNYTPSGVDNLPTNGMYLLKNITTVDGIEEKDNIYNYGHDLSGLYYGDIYTQLIGYVDSSFNDSGISMIKPGKYSSHYFESNYADLSDNVTKDFKHFYSASHTIAGNGLFNQS